MEDSANLKGQSALITGASSGIGRATAKALASHGVSVALTARREKKLQNVGDEIESTTDVEALVLPADVSDLSAVQAAVETAADTFDGLNIVVSNAGVLQTESVEEISIEDYKTMMDVNVNGTFYVTRAALPHLKESSGTLIFVSSFAGQYPRPDSTLYASTKWWARGFARSLAGSVGREGVAVTAINPTIVRTELGSNEGEPLKEQYESGEAIEPEEVADGIVFAAKQEYPSSVMGLDLYARGVFSHF